jgi:hypothetical protein
MASFTDSPQAYLTQYTPKVDLNLYAGTLDYKQQQYNQGVARVQGSIDQVAGLDIMHPLAKEYLQSKLSDMSSKLNTMAGGDFSNQSLVGQAMSLAPQIAKDEKIQNALISTQQIRSLTADQAVKEKAGKYTDLERWYDNQGVVDYLGSNNLNHSYQGPSKATEAYDGLGALAAAIKEKAPDEQVSLDNYGQIQLQKSKLTSRTPAQIQAIIDSQIQNDPRIGKHFQMLGEFNYRNITAPQQMSQMLNIETNSIVGGYKQMLDAIDAKAKTDTQGHAEYWASQKMQVLNEFNKWVPTGQYYQNVKEMAENGNLTGAKVSLQMKSAQANLIQKYTKQDLDLSLVVNEGAKFALEQKDRDRNYLLNIRKEDRQDREFNWKQKIDQMNYDANNPSSISSTKVAIDNTPASGSYDMNAQASRLAMLDEQYRVQAVPELRSAWQNANKNGSDADFAKYIENQKKAYADNSTDEKGNPLVDPIFNSWRQKYDPIIRKQNALQSITDRLENEASALFNVESSLPNKVNLPIAPYKDSTGRVINTMIIDPKRDKAFIGTMTDLYSDIQSEVHKVMSLEHDPETKGTVISTNRMNDIKKAALEKFRGNPYYGNLKAIIDHEVSGGTPQAYANIIAPQLDIRNKQRAYINDKLKSVGQNVNYVGKLIVDKNEKEQLSTAVLGMTDNKLELGEGDNRGIKVTHAYRDDQGKLHVTGLDHKNKPFDVTPNIQTDKVIPVNTSEDIDWEVATTGKTSTDPYYALHTKNNLLSYQLVKDDAGYRLWILGTGGRPIMTNTVSASKDEIRQKVEMMSQKQTRVDILNSLNQVK